MAASTEEEDIKEVLYRYSIMVDRRRWELIPDVFASTRSRVPSPYEEPRG